MPYSLVSAATLGFDLVRLPAGRSVAEVLLAGLDAGTASLRLLAAARPSSPPGVAAVRSRRAREIAAQVPRVRGAVREDREDRTDRLATLVTQLERGTIGDAITLERLIRDDVLDPREPALTAVAPDVLAGATEVLADAAVGYWAADVLPPTLRSDLTAPFDSVGSDLRSLEPGTGDLGPATRQLHELLDALQDLDESGRARWRAAVEDGRDGRRSWSAAMHEAAWAAHLSARTRALAAAQLHAVRAFVDGGFGPRDGAHGVWNAVAGCVQGAAMADLLDDASLAVLQGPWLHVTGRTLV